MEHMDLRIGGAREEIPFMLFVVSNVSDKTTNDLTRKKYSP